MSDFSLKELQENYDFNLDEIVNKINSEKAELVLVQFADGLKPYSISIVDYLREKTDSEFLIWFGSCYGACDIPNLSEELKREIDLFIQFGHNELMPDY